MSGVKYPHTHSWMCTRGVCGVGPSRDELVRTTLLKRLENHDLLHYKESEVEIMRLAIASSAPSSMSSRDSAPAIEHGIDGGAVDATALGSAYTSSPRATSPASDAFADVTTPVRDDPARERAS